MKKAFVASLAVLTLSLMVGPLAGAQPPAATDEEIEQAVAKGVAWLANRQNGDGSWGEDWVDEEGNNRDEDKTARTCFVLVKLEERANELAEKYPDLGIESPFDPDYPYSDNVIRGWRYVFDLSRVHKQTLSVQRHNGNPDDPDTNGNGYGIYFDTGGGSQTYTTGICLMALAASRTPDRPSDGGLDFDGDGNLDTFGEIAQEAVDWLAFAQGDWGNDEGGWHYGDIDNNQGNVNTDNSNSGYAVLGLAYAEAEEYRFKCTIPAWVKTELNVWIGTIQDPLDGGSYYDPDDPPEERGRNELRTGNLIFEMKFFGNSPDTPRFQRALEFIEDYWRHDNTDPGWGYNVDPAGYQAMYCLMKGLKYSRIDRIDTDGDGKRDDGWSNQEPPASPAQDFASVLVAQQDDGGSWSGCGWGDDILCTTWALLTLETAAPEGSVPQLPSEIPETSSLVLLGSGLAALASYIGLQLRARRRK